MPSSVPDRQQLLGAISDAALSGNLGLFVGAGFSKGVLQYHHSIPALAWGELLEAVCKEFGLTYNDFAKPGVSYPDVASSISDAYGKKQSPALPMAEAQLRFKEAVARHTTWYPSKEQRDHFGPILSALSPNWIITTNYDLVIESLLVGKSLSIGPGKALPTSRHLIPVYHLHGMKYDPKSIVITNEDYVSLFRPNEYRQAKLATVVKESMTVLLGYGLGDINVLTALDWCRNVYSGTAPTRSTDFILVLYSKSPAAQPYRNEQDILVVETDDLATFMDELKIAWDTAQATHSAQQAKLAAIANQLDSSPDAMVEAFIDDPAKRASILSVLKKFDIELIASFMTFLAACLDKTWERSLPSGAFGAYDQQLVLILDLLTTFEFQEMPPALFELLAVSLEKLGQYIGHSGGQSWAANDTWANRKGSIPKKTVEELRNHAEKRWFYYSTNLLKGL